MTDIEADVTPQGSGLHANDDFVRRAARAQHEAALRLTGGHSLDDAVEYTIRRLADTLGASRAFFATWAGPGYVGRALVGAPNDEQQAFSHRPLPVLPSESASTGEVVRITEVAALGSTHPWLAQLACADDVTLAVGTWAGKHPTCVVGLTGLGPVGDDRRLAIESFILILMGTTFGETLVRQRHHVEMQRGEALDTLADELDGERRRISHEIHDNVLQSVSSIAHFLETLSASSESKETRDVLERLRLEAQTSAITLRQIVNDFEPEQRAEESTTLQVRSLTARVSDLFGLKVDVDVGPGVDDAALARPILRVLRQALDNIITHADATKVKVAVAINTEDELSLTVDDNGKTAEKAGPWDPGVGLRSMTQVANKHGGTLAVEPAPAPPGTRVSATFSISSSQPRPAAGTGGAELDGSALSDEDLRGVIRKGTLSVLDQGRQPTISYIAETVGLRRRDILARYVSADAMIADATTSLVNSIMERWARFEPIDQNAPLHERLDTLLDRRFQMEVWGRPVRLHTMPVDPSPRFDEEALTAFHSELSAMDPTQRIHTGRLVSWLLRVRTIRAILSDDTVEPDIARATISSVATTLLRGDRSED